jgi:hypothetical protein
MPRIIDYATTPFLPSRLRTPGSFSAPRPQDPGIPRPEKRRPVKVPTLTTIRPEPMSKKGKAALELLRKLRG